MSPLWPLLIQPLHKATALRFVLINSQTNNVTITLAATHNKFKSRKTVTASEAIHYLQGASKVTMPRMFAVPGVEATRALTVAAQNQ